MNSETLETLDTYSKNKYKYGFVTEIDNEKAKKGLSEEFVLRMFKAIHQESINNQEKVINS